MSASEGAAPVLLVFWAFVCACPEGGEAKIKTKRVASNMRIASFISIILSLNFSPKNLRRPNAFPFWPLQPRRYPGWHSAASVFFCSLLEEAAFLLSTVWLFDWAQLGGGAATAKMKSVGRNTGFRNFMASCPFEFAYP
jgi:hypothetical protein